MNTIKTASFHIVKPCNMKCKFCYATFEDFKVGKQMDLSDAKKVDILSLLSYYYGDDSKKYKECS